MLEYLLTALFGIIGAIAVLNEKEKATIETHIKAALILGLVSIFLGFLVVFEYYAFSAVPGYTVEFPQTLIPIPSGMEMMFPFIAFFGSFINYIIAGIVAKIYYYFKETVRL